MILKKAGKRQFPGFFVRPVPAWGIRLKPAYKSLWGGWGRFGGGGRPFLQKGPPSPSKSSCPSTSHQPTCGSANRGSSGDAGDSRRYTRGCWPCCAGRRMAGAGNAGNPNLRNPRANILAAARQVSARGRKSLASGLEPLGLTVIQSSPPGRDSVPLLSTPSSNPRACRRSISSRVSCKAGSPPVNTM